ncbi:MAG TPA: T9SS type A sorting domain-containing protein, partial [Flammeovirgaceae bacterium]|nr:T9SS type A sorting domain-containing protein [Flammeovirgaceae bacterium]
NVTLTIPITNNAGGRISEAPENTNPLSADSWEIRLLRTDREGYEMQLAAVGMAEDALYSYDKYDRVQPPAIAETPRMVVSHPEFFEPAFQKDIRTTKNYEKWEFTYTGPANSGKEEVIYWDNSYFGADAPPVYLLDKTRFKMVDMRQQDTYSFVNGGTTEFEIHFGEGALEALLPEDVLFTTPYPNPFSSAVNFNIGLPSAAKEYQVQVDIYNTMGQQITSLQASNIVGGYYNFSWNGLDEKGQAVPDGVYIYRMTIAGENSRVVSGKIIKH